MADDSKSGSGLGGNAFLWLALLTAGSTFFLSREAPFKDSRPPSATAISEEQLHDRQNIDSRLWQDPFSAVERSLQRERKVVLEMSRLTAAGSAEKVSIEGHQHSTSCGSNALDHCSLEQVLQDAKSDELLLVLGVMVSRASYSEGAEFRRRIRYAVLAALDVEGYRPRDPDHIGAIFSPPPTFHDAFIPFEWLTPDEDNKLGRVLVLWLNEDAIATEPLHRLASISLAVRNKIPRAMFKVLGPEYSGTLEAIGENYVHLKPCESPRGSCEADEAQALNFYLYSSTVAVEAEIPNLPVHVHRMIARDCVLAEQVVRELKRRKLDPPAARKDTSGETGTGALDENGSAHHVAIISEWGSGYDGQPRVFADAVNAVARMPSCADQPDGVTNAVERGSRAPKWLHPYSYLRGLDGERPLSSEDKDGSRDADGSEKKANSRPDPKQLERAEGDSQFDYLRRLADRIERSDAQLREKGSKIDVIGLMGS